MLGIKYHGNKVSGLSEGVFLATVTAATVGFCRAGMNPWAAAVVASITTSAAAGAALEVAYGKTEGDRALGVRDRAVEGAAYGALLSGALVATGYATKIAIEAAASALRR